LRRSGPELGRLYARFDRLAELALGSRQAWVATHGEPHTANVLWRQGGPVLVDWESLRLAPRERDLRTVLRGADGAEPLSAYVAHGGTAELDADMVELFDLEWWLSEVAEYAVRFHGPHDGDEDDTRFHEALLTEVVPAVDQAVTKATVR
jgi:spectinomycin phosphotransferase